MAVLITINRPSDGPSIYTLQPTLDGVLYTVQHRWNEVEGFWYQTVLDAEGANVLIGDRKLVVNTLIDPGFTGRSPPGLFYLLDTGNPPDRAAEAGYDDIGNRCQLYYFLASELA